jgi:hypothetical protein
MMLPDFTDFKTWANSLTIDFPTDDIPYLYDENNWKQWGNTLIQTTSFSQNNAPSPENYSDSLKWAKDVFYSMNNN